MKRIALFCLATMLAAAGPAVAHHGWGGYDASKALTLTGVVEQSAYENPHGEMKLRVTQPAPKLWTVTLAPPFRMQARGLPVGEMKAGATVTVVGYPNKTDPNEMRAERITINGKTTELR